MIWYAGMWLFAARELPTRTLIGYYCGVVVWRLGQMLPYDEHTVIEPLDEVIDAYTILMHDSKGEWVTVSPGGCGEPSLYMGFQFMNDIGLSFDNEMPNQTQVCRAMYNTQITEDGCVYTTRMIAKGTELLCAYVQERMIPEEEQENFVEGCAQRVQARYGETKPKKNFVALSEKYSSKGDGDRKRRAKERTQVKRKSESGVAMQKLGTEEQKRGRTLAGISDEKKLSRLLKVGRRLKDSSDSESFEALESEPKIKFSVVDESSVTTNEEMERKLKFSVEDVSSVTTNEETEWKLKLSVEDESSVTTNEGEESYDSERVSLTEL